MQHIVTYQTQIVKVNDPQHGLLVERVIKFPTFTAAVSFARTVKDSANERVVGKPVVEQVA